MKTSIYGFLLTGIVLLLSISINAQTNTSWFTVNEVSEKVWVLSNNNIDNIYLIEGKDSALLIDTGIGAADLASAAARTINLPEAREGMAAAMSGDAALSPEDVYSGRTYNTRLLPLEEGQIFNLGGRFIKVMETSRPYTRRNLFA